MRSFFQGGKFCIVALLLLLPACAWFTGTKKADVALPEGIVRVATEEEIDNLVKSNDVVIIDFFATWCGPCKRLGEWSKDLVKKYPKLKIGEVNVDDAKAKPSVDKAFAEHGARGVPLLLFYKGGKLVHVQKGAFYNPTEYENKIKELAGW